MRELIHRTTRSSHLSFEEASTHDPPADVCTLVPGCRDKRFLPGPLPPHQSRQQFVYLPIFHQIQHARIDPADIATVGTFFFITNRSTLYETLRDQI